MKYLNGYRLFEAKKLNEYDNLMGKMLHLYGSIPLEKEKASIVIAKIIYGPTHGEYYRLGQDVDIKNQKDHDKVRFKDYFDSLLKSKDSRGHNFEGTIAGLYDGELAKRGEKWDLVIGGETWSLKFVDQASKAPEIGSFKKTILIYDRKRLEVYAEELGLKKRIDYKASTKNQDLLKKLIELDTDSELEGFYLLEDKIVENGGLTYLFRSDKDDLKEIAFNVISEGITGGWIIAYPVKDDNGEINIRQHIIDIDEMRDLFMKGYSVSPKGGLKYHLKLALSSRFVHMSDYHVVSNIIIPKLRLSELRRISRNSTEDTWAENVFGEYGSKIRPDVLRYIKGDSENISKRLITFNNFRKKID